MNTAAARELVPAQLLGQPELEEETLDLVRYWRAINRNKWRILLLVIAIGVLAALVAFSLKPVFRSTATMLVEPNRPKLVSIEEVYNALNGVGYDFIRTQAEILKSRELASKLVRRMELAKHPLYDPRQQPPAFWAEWVPASFQAEPAKALLPEQVEDRVTRAVQRGLNVQVVRNSQLIALSFESNDRKLAAEVPNALAQVYIEADLEARMKMTQQATSWLTAQSGELRKKLTESEQSLQSFRERERIIDTKGLAQSGVTKQLEDLSKALIDARARRNEAEHMLQQVNAVVQGKTPDTLETLPAMQKHPLVLRYKEQEADAEKRLNEAAKRYGAEHPKLIAAESEMKSARENLRRQIAGVAQTVSREYEAAKANEASLERSLAGARDQIQNLNRKEFQLASLEREVTTSRQMYEMFVQRFKETSVGSDMQSAIARVVDPAIVPQIAYGPNKRLIVGLSLLGALLAGISLALLIERLNNTVKTSHDVEPKLGIPLLGVVQRTKVKRGHLIERICLDEPQSVMAEAIRTIRSGVLLSALDNPRKVIVVTSSAPGEGKTTVAMNLGFALAQVKKTLLVDGDMRRPRMGKVIGEKSQSPLLGLAQLVAGEVTADKCILAVPGSNLHILPAGRVPPNPLELLASHRFTEVMAELEKVYEIIIFDSPPIQLVSDALVLSNVASEVLYVVKADDTPYPLARQGIRRLQRVNAPLVGVVLNQLDIAKADRYYGEYSGYGGRYGKYSKKYGYGYGPVKE